jgi:hypothetical protein
MEDHRAMTGKDHSSGGMTGATGDLTPDDIQRDFEPGEWREASDAAHQAEVTRSQASHGHEHSRSPEDADDPAAGAEGGEPRIGGDERADREEHL